MSSYFTNEEMLINGAMRFSIGEMRDTDQIEALFVLMDQVERGELERTGTYQGNLIWEPLTPSQIEKARKYGICNLTNSLWRKYFLENQKRLDQERQKPWHPWKVVR